jgi:hypothetical protein
VGVESSASAGSEAANAVASAAVSINEGNRDVERPLQKKQRAGELFTAVQLEHNVAMVSCDDDGTLAFDYIPVSHLVVEADLAHGWMMASTSTLRRFEIRHQLQVCSTGDGRGLGVRCRESQLSRLPLHRTMVTRRCWLSAP